MIRKELETQQQNRLRALLAQGGAILSTLALVLVGIFVHRQSTEETARYELDLKVVEQASILNQAQLSSDAEQGQPGLDQVDAISRSQVAFAHMNTLVDRQGAHLTWGTMEERMLKLFWVERSIDNEVYEVIGQVGARGKAQEGGSFDYQYTDTTLKMIQMPRVYYRIRGFGLDRRKHLSEPIQQDLNLDVGLYARIDGVNKGQLFIRYAADRNQEVEMRILSPVGNPVLSEMVRAEFDPQLKTIDVSRWPRGTYFLQIQGAEVSVTEEFAI